MFEIKVVNLNTVFMYQMFLNEKIANFDSNFMFGGVYNGLI
jgi:hypothetical protein